MAHLLDVFKCEGQTALVTKIVLLAAFVLNVITRCLVDGIVSQVHV